MKQPYELLVRWGTDGSVAGVIARYTETINGRLVEYDPEPLEGLVNDPVFGQLAGQFAAAAVAERDALLETAKTAVSADDHATVVSARDAALAEVARLTDLLPPEPGPREVTPREFLERISDADKVAIMQSRDPRCMKAIWTLFTVPSIDLDSPLLVQLIDALVAAGIEIDAADRARIFA